MTRSFAFFGATYLAVMLGGSAVLRHASADAPVYRAGDAITLAQLCAGERSAREEHRDTCTAMLGVVVRGAQRRGMSVGAYARSYSAVFRVQRRPWLLELRRDGSRPESWPAASWSAYREDWLSLVEHVDAFVAGEVAPVCGDEPEHFGSRQDAARLPSTWARACPELDDEDQLFFRRAGDAS